MCRKQIRARGAPLPNGKCLSTFLGRAPEREEGGKLSQGLKVQGASKYPKLQGPGGLKQ